MWHQWVTGGERVTVWDNKKQVEEEKSHPNPSGNHPMGVETRWDINALVKGAPAGTEWMIMEMGNAPFVGTDGYLVLFGLTTEGEDVRLRSYDTDNDEVRALITALHKDHSATEPTLDFSTFVKHEIEVFYKYGYNATQKQTLFFGTGEGKLRDRKSVV